MTDDSVSACRTPEERAEWDEMVTTEIRRRVEAMTDQAIVGLAQELEDGIAADGVARSRTALLRALAAAQETP